jgi:LemA protein
MDIVLGLLVVGLLVVVALIYNALVRTRLRVREAWSAVDVQLQRRASLIPNLVEVVKGYAAHEQGTLTRVVEARGALTQAEGPRDSARANEDLGSALGSLIAVAEAYPGLKADEQFRLLQTELADTENQIAYARNYYNGAVEIYNTRVQTVPGLLIARPFNFRLAEFFSADAASRRSVSVQV